MSYQERALVIIDRLSDSKAINIRERGTLRRAILLPERPQGVWQPDMDSFYCDQCGVTALEINRKWYKSNFCPNCGADMRGDNK